LPATDLLLHERHTLIRKRLARDGRVIAAALAQELSISEDTIRRDLRELAAAGLCKRVYGGALPTEAEAAGLVDRTQMEPGRKDALARAAISIVRPAMSLFIDAGSTNLAIARALPASMPLTVITNAPSIAAVLTDRRNVEVIMIGGQLDHRSGAIIGAGAIAEAGRFHPDLCILGSCGLDADSGISAESFEESEFKRYIAGRCKAVLAAVINVKLGRPAPFDVVPIEACHHLVVEHDADPAITARLSAAGLDVIRALAPTPIQAFHHV
jgi:DeoR/GlpR family transcriptional regulator of sugar metabolism